MEHTLKTWPEHYTAIDVGQKTVELRLNDRPYQVGDALLLREYEPLEAAYTGRQMRVRVTHIVRGGEWLAPGYVAMSIRRMAEDGEARVQEDWRKVADQQREELTDAYAAHRLAETRVAELRAQLEEMTQARDAAAMAAEKYKSLWEASRDAHLSGEGRGDVE